MQARAHLVDRKYQCLVTSGAIQRAEEMTNPTCCLHRFLHGPRALPLEKEAVAAGIGMSPKEGRGVGGGTRVVSVIGQMQECDHWPVSLCSSIWTQQQNTRD